MDYFGYQRGLLHAEDVSVTDIAEKIGTPFYCYSERTLRRHLRVFSEAFAPVPTTVCFAVKANSNLAVLKTLASDGAGADTVSEGEIRRALAAGVPPEKIVFSGVGKTAEEMRFALMQQVGQFNVESEPELELLNHVAAGMGTKAPVAIRVNPDVDAKTNDKISTGRKTDKFGVDWELAPALYAKAQKMEGIDIVGIATHIGSQLTDLAPFRQAFTKIGTMVEQLRASGTAISRVDLGGGLGIPYRQDENAPPVPAEYGKVVIDTIRHLDCSLVLEPGRLIAGNAGILVTRVIYVKHTPARTFVIVDAAMNDLARPSLYNAHHDIVPVSEQYVEAEYSPVDVVGPVCETTDIFARQRALPPVKEGDLLAFRSAGAYGAVMSSTYNSRLLVPEIMVNGSRFAIIRRRQTYEELLHLDIIPEWL